MVMGLSEDVAALERNFSDKVSELNDLRRRYAVMGDELRAQARDINARCGMIEDLEKENERLLKIIERLKAEPLSALGVHEGF